MNRFRTRKKTRDAAEIAGRLSNESEDPFLPSFSTKSFKKSRKGQAEAKPEVDLSTALPSSDDFRTSLLMPNLSARFSMLREQDDPTTKLGKANDDSVLFPKRASRLNLFNHTGLSDISEVASIDSIRPPFAYGRVGSYHSGDGDATDDDSSHSGSIMGRSKHREGNNLFGGRQKIYKISAGGSGLAKDVHSGGETHGHSSGGRMGGKFLYGDDVSSSAFQKLREREQDEQDARGRRGSAKDDTDDAPNDDGSASPLPAGYNQSRETSSSTASAPWNMRTSTAATSITSQSVVSLSGTSGNVNNTANSTSSQQPQYNHTGPDRGFPKSRRLYGQGLDQHMQDQQYSALHKLESLQQRTPGSGQPPNLLQSQSAFNLRDHYQRAGPLYALPDTRAISPPPSAASRNFAGLDRGIGESGSVQPNRNAGQGLPLPLSPPMSDEDDVSVFSSAVQPNDRGKATALGAFNKPSTPYDEQQYSRRQFQLHQARGTASPRSASPAHAINTDPQTKGAKYEESISGSFSRRLDQPIPKSTVDNVKERQPASNHSPRKEMHLTSNGTFLANASGSEESSEVGSETENDLRSSPSTSPKQQQPSLINKESSPPRPPNSASDDTAQTPAASQRLYMDLPDASYPEMLDTEQQNHARNDSRQSKGMLDDINADSPTLGPTSGLSGLVRAHLRNDSGQSSIYPAPSPVLTSRALPRRSMTEPTPNIPNDSEQSRDTRSNAWDLDDWDNNDQSVPDPIVQEAKVPATAPLSTRAKQMLGQAAALRDQERLRAQQATKGGKAPLEQEREATNFGQERSWSDEIRGRHQREGSTETQKERAEFANELAIRRRGVEENLRNDAENRSRSGSPMHNRQPLGTSPTKSGMNKGPLAGNQDGSSKAMKMLGISEAGTSGKPPRPYQRSYWKNEEQRMPPDIVKGPKLPQDQSSARTPYFRGAQSTQAVKQRKYSTEGQHGFNRGGTSPPSVMNSGQEQSNPATSRERSENGHGADRDGQDRAHADGEAVASSSIQARASPTNMKSNLSEQESTSITSDSHREMGRSAAANSYRNNAPVPIRTDSPAGSDFSTRPSPMPGHPSNATVPEPDASPEKSIPTSPSMVSGGFPTSGRIPANRKKSVNKTDISEPTFISCTSSVNTINLPAGPGFSNRMEGTNQASAPPLPPINPRRRTTQKSILSALGKSDRAESPSLPSASEFFHGTRRTSGGEGERRPPVRQKLRKSSSEGGNLNARARHQALMAPSPAMPPSVTPSVPSSVPPNGGMF